MTLPLVRTIEAELKKIANQFKKDTNIAEVETKFESITEPESKSKRKCSQKPKPA